MDTLKRLLLAVLYLLAGPFIALGLKIFARSGRDRDSYWIPVLPLPKRAIVPKLPRR